MHAVTVTAVCVTLCCCFGHHDPCAVLVCEAIPGPPVLCVREGGGVLVQPLVCLCVASSSIFVVFDLAVSAVRDGLSLSAAWPDPGSAECCWFPAEYRIAPGGGSVCLHKQAQNLAQLAHLQSAHQ